MKKSQQVTLGLLAGMALTFTSGCRKAERRDCVDESGRIVSDQSCQMVEERRRSGYTGVLPYYHYLYGGSTSGRIGDPVLNGNPMPNMRTGSASGGGVGGFLNGITRGGFGSTGSAVHAGGGGGGE